MIPISKTSHAIGFEVDVIADDQADDDERDRRPADVAHAAHGTSLGPIRLPVQTPTPGAGRFGNGSL